MSGHKVQDRGAECWWWSEGGLGVAWRYFVGAGGKAQRCRRGSRGHGDGLERCAPQCPG